MSNRTGLGNVPVRNMDREQRAINARLVEADELRRAFQLAGVPFEVASSLAVKTVLQKQ